MGSQKSVEVHKRDAEEEQSTEPGDRPESEREKEKKNEEGVSVAEI